jgi:hypothetical protein
MKRFLPLILATGVLLLSGCHTADIPEGAMPEGGHGTTTGHETGGEVSHEVDDHASTPSTASAFPSSTPPSGKESVTPAGYWGHLKENTKLGEEHAEGGHGEVGAPASH